MTGPTASAPAALPPGALFIPSPGTSSSGNTAAPNLLVLLHGAGDTPAPFARLAAKLALPATAGLALQAPFRLGPTGFTWFEEGEDDASDAAALARARPALAAAVDAAGWRRDRVHLFGFGEGGAAVLDLVIAAASDALGPGPPGSAGGGTRFGSAVVVSGGLLPGALARLDSGAGEGAASAGPSTPVLLTRGERDEESAPAGLVAATVAALKQAGLSDVSLHTVPGKGGGMLGPDRGEVEVVMKHWARCLKAGVPEGCVEADG